MRYAALIVFLVFFLESSAQIRLPDIIQNGMVLQRDQKIKLWGWASPSEKITLNTNGRTYRTITGKEGRWEISLAPVKAGGPYTMTFSGKNKVFVKDILFGDVWLCSGQSNMEHNMGIHDVTYSKEIEQANYPNVRQFLIPKSSNLQGPVNLISGRWESAVGNSIRSFSAVAYFFAKKIYQETGVPIGIINASVGGSPIEAWISNEGLSCFEDIKKQIEQNREFDNKQDRVTIKEERDASTLDQGLLDSLKWFKLEYKPQHWRNINIPGYWEDQGIKNLDGVVWYRRYIDISVSSVNEQQATVLLGRIVDSDELYVNGYKVGSTGYQYPQRRYIIPKGILKRGENLFVIRVTNNSGKGGFVPDKPYALLVGSDTIDLKGYWQYKVGVAFMPGEYKDTFITLPQNQPTALYNGMIAPLKEYGIRGVLWYQGESNTGKPVLYEELMSALVKDWRRQFHMDDLPFVYVQLPGFMEYNYLPSESNWARLREAQLHCLRVPNTAMVVGLDGGEWNDIHPEDKELIGVRAALAAEGTVYKKNIVYSGPIFKESTVLTDKIILSFKHVGGGLITNDGEPLSDFAIAGSDKKFVWAKAVIENNKVVVSNDKVSEPKYVRYAWADNPINPNLYNKEGLPASPFRTDK